MPTTTLAPSAKWVLVQWSPKGPSVSRPMTHAKARKALALLPNTEAQIVTFKRYQERGI